MLRGMTAKGVDAGKCLERLEASRHCREMAGATFRQGYAQWGVAGDRILTLIRLPQPPPSPEFTHLSRAAFEKILEANVTSTTNDLRSLILRRFRKPFRVVFRFSRDSAHNIFPFCAPGRGAFWHPWCPISIQGH